MLLLSMNATNTPCDIIGILGSALGGFILGMCLFGEDGQLHSQIFMGFAITGFVLLFGLSSYGLYKNMSIVNQIDYDNYYKVIDD